LAFGVNFEIELASGQYCAGFHKPNKNDSASCGLPSIVAISLEWKNNYTVTSDYLTTVPPPQTGSVEPLPSYGLGPTFFLNLPVVN
jgi:hypothetical protein